jgi:hypothetical protein
MAQDVSHRVMLAGAPKRAWHYFFFYADSSLGVWLFKHDAPLHWNGGEWVTGRQKAFEDGIKIIP